MKDILKVALIGLVLTTAGLFVGCEEEPGAPSETQQFQQREMPEGEEQQEEEAPGGFQMPEE